MVRRDAWLLLLLHTRQTKTVTTGALLDYLVGLPPAPNSPLALHFLCEEEMKLDATAHDSFFLEAAEMYSLFQFSRLIMDTTRRLDWNYKLTIT